MCSRRNVPAGRMTPHHGTGVVLRRNSMPTIELQARVKEQQAAVKQAKLVSRRYLSLNTKVMAHQNSGNTANVHPYGKDTRIKTSEKKPKNKQLGGHLRVGLSFHWRWPVRGHPSPSRRWDDLKLVKKILNVQRVNNIFYSL